MKFLLVCCFVGGAILQTLIGVNGLQPVPSFSLPNFSASPGSISDEPVAFGPPFQWVLQTSNLTDTVRFAVIGDFGSGSADEVAVADLVKSWNPDFIITVGDNNYPSGAISTIDQNIGQFYHDFIYPYTGAYGSGSPTNRFFPSLGNHDWQLGNVTPYLNYFALPGNERYYEFIWGPVHLFALDSDANEPDGISSDSVQAAWLQNKLAASVSCWNLVYFHHSPYSSGQQHGSSVIRQWPYPAWGADAVLTGHDHLYERIVLNGFPYFVNGLGGRSIYAFQATPVPGSQVRYNANYGAMLIVAGLTMITYQFIAIDGTTVDTYSQVGECWAMPYQLYLPIIIKL
ncbi:MAG: metallophosphoesterase [Chloroflexi bacterium]|nr:metallophosphoesterase [Chloroflexota bacterium]